MKYIRYKESGFFIFPGFVPHNMMQNIVDKFVKETFDGDEVISAGHIKKDGDNLCCVGDSPSLRLKTRLDDDYELNKQFKSIF